MKKAIVELPKIDLHCHLDGSLPVDTASRLLGRKVRLEEVQVKENCQSLAEYLQCFDLPLQCMQTKEGLHETAKDFLLDAAKENVRYVEVRFAPLLSVNENLNCKQVIESVLEGLEEARKCCGTYYNVIVCAMRGTSDEKNIKMMKTAREFLGEGVCAMDLAGNEAAYPMEEYISLFNEATKLGFPFTIHGGECGRVENVLEAVKVGAARIGHGIALRGNPGAIDICKKKNIAIEMCPISNRQTKAVQNMKDYPIREFLDAGLKVTINTDNRTVSNTTIAKELEYIQNEFGISDEETKLILNNAIDAAFADDAVKHTLWKNVNHQ